MAPGATQGRRARRDEGRAAKKPHAAVAWIAPPGGRARRRAAPGSPTRRSRMKVRLSGCARQKCRAGQLHDAPSRATPSAPDPRPARPRTTPIRARSRAARQAIAAKAISSGQQADDADVSGIWTNSAGRDVEEDPVPPCVAACRPPALARGRAPRSPMCWRRRGIERRRDRRRRCDSASRCRSSAEVERRASRAP